MSEDQENTSGSSGYLTQNGDSFKFEPKKGLEIVYTNLWNMENNSLNMEEAMKSFKDKKIDINQTESESDSAADPRIKSPDDFLKRMAPKKVIVEKTPEKIETLDVAPLPNIERNFEPLPNIDRNPSALPDIPREEYGIPELSRLQQDLEQERKNIQMAKENKKEIVPPINMVENSVMTPAQFLSQEPEIKLQSNLDSHAQKEEKGIEPRPTSSRPKTPQFSQIEREVELVELRAKYEKEIAQWKEYAQNVKHWQAQVLEIVQNLKKELAKSRNDQNEAKALRDMLRKKDEELKKAHASSKSKLVSWMKNIGKPTSPAKDPKSSTPHKRS